MITQCITLNKTLSAFVIACAMAAFAALPAVAQTAGNVACDGCVGSKDIKNSGIRSRDIKNGQVKNADIARNAITSSKIADGAVTRDRIADGAVNGDKVANGSLTVADLGDGVGVDFDGGDQFFPLSFNVDTVIRSVSFSAPTSGFVIANASGVLSLVAEASVTCSLTTGSTLTEDSHQGGGINENHNQILGMTKGFVVPAGSTTFNLICRRTTAADAAILDSHLTAIYAPIRY